MKIWMKFLAGLMMAILAAAAGGCGPDVPLRQSGETRIVVDDEGQPSGCLLIQSGSFH